MVIILYCLGNNDKNRNLNIFNIDAIFSIMVETRTLLCWINHVPDTRCNFTTNIYGPMFVNLKTQTHKYGKKTQI